MPAYCKHSTEACKWHFIATVPASSTNVSFQTVFAEFRLVFWPGAKSASAVLQSLLLNGWVVRDDCNLVGESKQLVCLFAGS